MENRLSNGLKYTPADGRVDVSWNKDATHAVIPVCDTSVGIWRCNPVVNVRTLFCSDRAWTRKIDGTGLGLAIVKHLDSTFHGEFSVESELGKGKTFSLRIPLSTGGSSETSRS
jgi:two-component system, OmpR family, phosphate regulon sensor histidine kinase PhoR